MTTIFLIILLFSVLVLVHELGHFLAAKKIGARVDEFGLGYPPRIIGVYKNSQGRLSLIGFWQNKKTKDINQTIYSLNFIPFGGFVKIFGENRSEEKASPKPDSFEQKSPLKRAIVIAAGVFANIVLAVLLFSVVFTAGAPVMISDTEDNPLIKDRAITVLDIAPGSPAEKAGLESGDNIKKIVILTKDEPEKIILPQNIAELQETIDQHKGEELRLIVQRGVEEKSFTLVPRASHPQDEGPLGVGLSMTGIIKYPWYRAVIKGIEHTVGISRMIIVGFYDLIKTLIVKGEMIAEVAGPVGIVKLSAKAANLGIIYLINFGALISLNLAIINFLPFPALDGGRFLLIIIEKLKSPLNPKIENRINAVGFAILILLMLFITARDVIRLF